MSNNEHDSPIITTPSSPPPSFRSVESSPATPTSRHFPHGPSDAVDQSLADAFGDDGSDSDEEDDSDDRQRLMRGASSVATAETVTPATTGTSVAPPPTIERRATFLPVFAPQPVTGGPRIYGGGSGSDGVFANLSAKPEAGEKAEEHPPVSCTIIFIAIPSY